VVVVCAMMQHVGGEHVDGVRDARFCNPHRGVPLVLFHVPK